MANHRHTVTIQVKPMDYPILSSVQTDKSLRVMVFSCEMDQTQPRHDILFPYQSEIKVNGGEIKANLRGLKNKPGSTRPVDITDALRLRQIGYANNIEMTYALTTKAGVPIQVSSLASPIPFMHYFMRENPVPVRHACC
jgi:E3 SUMO-protein ligase PIAS1